MQLYNNGCAQLLFFLQLLHSGFLGDVLGLTGVLVEFEGD